MGAKFANEYKNGTRSPSGALVVDGKFIPRFFSSVADARAGGYVPLDEIGRGRGGDFGSAEVVTTTHTAGVLSSGAVLDALQKQDGVASAAFCHLQNTLAELHAVAFSVVLFDIEAMGVSEPEMTDEQRHMCNLKAQLGFEAAAALADLFNATVAELGINCVHPNKTEGTT